MNVICVICACYERDTSASVAVVELVVNVASLWVTNPSKKHTHVPPMLENGKHPLVHCPHHLDPRGSVNASVGAWSTTHGAVLGPS